MYHPFKYNVNAFLAHRIRIAEILPWDRKSCLADVTLPRLSREGCALVVLELTHMVANRRYCYVKMTSSCEIV